MINMCRRRRDERKNNKWQGHKVEIKNYLCCCRWFFFLVIYLQIRITFLDKPKFRFFARSKQICIGITYRIEIYVARKHKIGVRQIFLLYLYFSSKIKCKISTLTSFCRSAKVMVQIIIFNKFHISKSV